MRILIIGSGGREHALVWKLTQEAEVFVAPGNPGIEEVAQCRPIKADDQQGIANLCKAIEPDLVVIGPENPLIAGLADRLRAEDLPVFGPGKEGAKLEGSKAFAKKLMAEAGVPTAGFETFTDAAEAENHARRVYDGGRQLAVKASGPALGKGVTVAPTLEEALGAIRAMMVDHAFGDAGATVVLEDRLSGKEFSLMAVCSGEDFVCLPVAQDYKRAYDGDRGPNTGGMGSNSPVPWLDSKCIETAKAQAIAPVLKSLKQKRIDYRGVLYAGILVEDGVPHCLEYNVRFGDPETQSIVCRLGEGFSNLLKAAALGEKLPKPKVLDNAAVSIVAASDGYPESPKIGRPISLKGDLEDGVHLFHSGTTRTNGQLMTSGGRVITLAAQARDLKEARQKAYRNIEELNFDGMYFRTDIAEI